MSILKNYKKALEYSKKLDHSIANQIENVIKKMPEPTHNFDGVMCMRDEHGYWIMFETPLGLELNIVKSLKKENVGDIELILKNNADVTEFEKNAEEGMVSKFFYTRKVDETGVYKDAFAIELNKTCVKAVTYSYNQVVRDAQVVSTPESEK